MVGNNDNRAHSAWLGFELSLAKTKDTLKVQGNKKSLVFFYLGRFDRVIAILLFFNAFKKCWFGKDILFYI